MPDRKKRPKDDGAEDIRQLARTMHNRLRELEGGGRIVAVTPAMEEVLANDPRYTQRNAAVQADPDPPICVLDECARLLRTTVSALLGEMPHPPVYGSRPFKAEIQRRRVHRHAGENVTPFTVLRFPPTPGVRAFAMIAEIPMAQASGDTVEEAEEALREALDAVLIKAYRMSIVSTDALERPIEQAPFAFQPPAAGRVR